MKRQELVRKATAFAMKAHDGQTRKGSGLPYIVHPIEVMSIVKKYKESKNIEDILAAALLHDTIEDCGVTHAELLTEFTPMVANLVLELTNDVDMIEKLGKEEYMNQKLVTLSNYALVIKLADMLANCSDRPNSKMTERIGNNLLFLSQNRVYTSTQGKLVDEIARLFDDYGMVVRF